MWPKNVYIGNNSNTVQQLERYWLSNEKNLQRNVTVKVTLA